MKVKVEVGCEAIKVWLDNLILRLLMNCFHKLRFLIIVWFKSELFYLVWWVCEDNHSPKMINGQFNGQLWSTTHRDNIEHLVMVVALSCCLGCEICGPWVISLVLANRWWLVTNSWECFSNHDTPVIWQPFSSHLHCEVFLGAGHFGTQMQCPKLCSSPCWTMWTHVIPNTNANREFRCTEPTQKKWSQNQVALSSLLFHETHVIVGQNRSSAGTWLVLVQWHSF